MLLLRIISFSVILSVFFAIVVIVNTGISLHQWYPTRDARTLASKKLQSRELRKNAGYSSNSTWLDSTRHIRRVEPMHFGCVELVEQHSSTRSTRRARLARLARHVELDWLDTSSSTGATCNLVMITVIHLLFNKLFTD